MDPDHLDLIPRAVRDKLDRIGVKLHLRDWQQLSLGERRQLVEQPCQSTLEEERYRGDLAHLIRRRTGQALEPLPKTQRTASNDGS